jgi:hypothetical protein
MVSPPDDPVTQERAIRKWYGSEYSFPIAASTVMLADRRAPLFPLLMLVLFAAL